MPAGFGDDGSVVIPLKTLLTEILIKECTVPQQTNLAELTLFPTEKDLWAWDPFQGEEKHMQVTFRDAKEL